MIGFRKNQFANPEGLVAFMQKSRGNVKMQADHKLVFKADWDLPEKRLKGVRTLVAQLAEIAGQGRRRRSYRSAYHGTGDARVLSEWLVRAVVPGRTSGICAGTPRERQGWP